MSQAVAPASVQGLDQAALCVRADNPKEPDKLFNSQDYCVLASVCVRDKDCCEVVLDLGVRVYWPQLNLC